MTKVVIVGAGFSGLISAITIKRNNSNIDVTILEKLGVPGKKILATGNGRCNYYNDNNSLDHFHSDNESFIDGLDTNMVLDFYNSLGIIPYIKDGYYYPYSKEASSIRNALLNECERLDVNITTNYRVSTIIKSDDKYIINNEITCDRLILCTGSPCYYKDRDFIGYAMAQELGHNIIDVLPGLVQLIGEGTYFDGWAGVRSEVVVSLYVDDELKKEEKGEIMLTDYGLSGICIFNLSSKVSNALDNSKNVRVDINFLPFLKEDPYKFLEDRNLPVKDSLERLINDKLVSLILDKCDIDSDSYFKDLDNNKKKLLVNLLISFRVNIIGTKDFDRAQIAIGGIDTKEINKDTMESTINKNLFFAGEVIDVDGDCGGYNIMFATISGIKAGLGASHD